jgi:hypothetical protein
MRIAYLVAAHRNATQLRRLLGAIDHPEHVYVIHVDRRAERAVHEAAQLFAKGRRNVHVMPGRKIIWAGESLLRIQLAAIDVALRIDDGWHQFVNLSGQCYPLLSQDAISRTLDAGGAGRNYVEVLDYAACSPAIRPRTRYWYLELGDGVVRVPWLRRRPPTDLRVFWGSNFVMLSRAFCAYLFRERLPARCHDYLRFVRMPEEFFFQTALMNSPFRNTHVQDHRRTIIWDGGPHPRTFTLADLPTLLTSQAFFARKFDDTLDAAVLDAIDRERLIPRAAAG